MQNYIFYAVKLFLHLKRSLISADAHRFWQCGTAIDDDL